MKVKSILFAANNYPTPTDPVQTFVEQLVIALSKRGIKVSVIAPFRIIKHYLRHTELHTKKREIIIKGGTPITVIRPRYITLGGRFEKFNLWNAQRAVCMAAEQLEEKPDVCYGHFWHWAYSLFPYAKKHNIPLFANTSETPIMLTDVHPADEMKDFVSFVRGVVCGSSFCRDNSIERKLTTKNNCLIAPNAIDSKLFFQNDRSELRKKYGFSLDDFIIAYTGWYSPQKGTNRLSEAITQLNDKSIKSFFIGDSRGEDATPTCHGILHKGRLPHEEIPKWLSMADIFVLPTLAEGSSNAIVEALACGLPVVSSNLPFNWDVLNESNSIMVDPMNVDKIAAAIKTLKDDKQKREEMSKAALATAAELTIDKRAEKIIRFIESRI